MKHFTKLYDFLSTGLGNFPWPVEIQYADGKKKTVGGSDQHWCGEPLRIHFHTKQGMDDVLTLNGMGVLDRFVRGEIDISGNLYSLTYLRKYFNLDLNMLQRIPGLIRNRLFQDMRRAKVNVQSHYDIPQGVLDQYLDKKYMSYSCAMFGAPESFKKSELVTAGSGKGDSFDSLEQAQWRKYNDALEFIQPGSGDTLLDVGCGYGGQLDVALEDYSFSKVVGCTHSQNQAEIGRKTLQKHSGSWELRQADYREDSRVFNHITSTGMVSHVGPRGLAPYVRNIRSRIKSGGRYVHHALMTPFTNLPLDAEVGAAFNKKYVWPGFHWFTLGQHIKALEENGFVVDRATNLSPNYAKTTAAWYERFMSHLESIRNLIAEPTIRAWQIYLAGASGSFQSGTSHVYRVYCRAV